MKKGVPDSNLTERTGVNAVERIFVTQFKWFFREKPISDFGIDAEVEIVEEGKPTGKLLALQIKTGASYFRRMKEDFVYYGDRRHLEYWVNHSLPVFLILHNPDDEMTLWQKIERRLIEETDKGWSIRIPRTNVLSKDAKSFFAKAIASDPESIRRYRFSVDLGLMKMFAETDAVFFQIDDWINKTLNIRGIKVYFDNPDKAEADLHIDVWAARYSIHELMDQLFPWLEYEYHEAPTEHAGEIESHVFSVLLNDAARQFIALEVFFKDGPTREHPTPPRSEDEWDDEDWNEWAFERAISKDD